MAETTATAKRMTAGPRTAARLSWGAAAMSLVLLAALHVVSPEFDPSWRMVSEYALGDYGWVLGLMFLCMAVSCLALLIAIKSQIRTIGGKIGLGFLLAAAVGLAMAAMFDMKHDLHGLAAMIGIPSLPIAAILLSQSLASDQAWSSTRRSLLWTAHLTWVSLLLMVTALAVMLPQNDGRFGPDVLIGWPNRLLLVSYGAWLMVVAWRAAQLMRERS